MRSGDAIAGADADPPPPAEPPAAGCQTCDSDFSMAGSEPAKRARSSRITPADAEPSGSRDTMQGGSAVMMGGGDVIMKGLLAERRSQESAADQAGIKYLTALNFKDRATGPLAIAAE